MRNFFPAVFPGDAVILLAQQCPIYYYHTMRQKNHCIPTIIILHKSGRSTRRTSLYFEFYRMFYRIYDFLLISAAAAQFSG